MLPSYCQWTGRPGGGCWALALFLWMTKPGAEGESGCGEGAGGDRGWDLRYGKGECMSCTCLGAEVEGESEGGLVSWREGAGLDDQGRLRVWV